MKAFPFLLIFFLFSACTLMTQTITLRDDDILEEKIEKKVRQVSGLNIDASSNEDN